MKPAPSRCRGGCAASTRVKDDRLTRGQGHRRLPCRSLCLTRGTRASTRRSCSSAAGRCAAQRAAWCVCGGTRGRTPSERLRREEQTHWRGGVGPRGRAAGFSHAVRYGRARRSMRPRSTRCWRAARAANREHGRRVRAAGACEARAGRRAGGSSSVRHARGGHTIAIT